jgi:hypothetical protein
MEEMNCGPMNQYYSFRNFRVTEETEAELCVSSWSGGEYKKTNIVIKIKPFPPGQTVPVVTLSSSNLQARCNLKLTIAQCENSANPYCKWNDGVCAKVICSECQICPSKFCPICKLNGNGDCEESLLDVQFTEGLRQEMKLDWKLKYSINVKPLKDRVDFEAPVGFGGA